MTDFSLTSVCLQSNTTHSICIYVKNVRLNFFFIVCSVCFFSSLLWCSIRSSLLRQRISLSVQMSHTKRAREKENSCQSWFIVFIFTFRLLAPFLSRSLSLLLLFFLLPCSLRTSRKSTRTNTRCSFAFMVSINAVDGARGAIQLELPSWIRKIARYITYDLNLWLFQIFKTKAVLIIAFLFGIGNVSGAHVWLFRFQWNF